MIAIHIVLLLIGLFATVMGIFSLFRRKKIYKEFLGYSFSAYTPKASLIAPVRGIDEKLKESIAALLHQNYPSTYEILFIIDSDDRETKAFIAKLIKNSGKARILLSKPLKTCSGKNSAVITGVKAAKYDILAFVDSDVIVHRDWLRNLVSPLDNEKTGVTTGYRFYLPKSFKDCVLSAWNSIGLAQMTGNSAFVWGGSFALKRSLLKKLRIAEAWAHNISEDSVVTDLIRKAKLKIQFVPKCIVDSHASGRYSHPLEFTTRQVLFVRYYWSFVYKIATAAYLFGRLAAILGIAALYMFLLTHSMIFLVEALLLLLPLLLSALSAITEINTMKKLTKSDASVLAYIPAYLLAQWLMTYNLLRAGTKNSITWRGRTYYFKK